MGEMDAHPERMVPAKHPDELGGDALRKHDGRLRADAHDFDRGDAPQLGEDPVEPVVAEHERLSARNEDVPDLRIAPDVRERPLEAGDGRMERAVAHDARARAVAAVRGAEVRHEKEHAVGVPVHEPRHRTHLFLGEGIGRFAGTADELRGARDDGPPQRLPRIVVGEQAHIVRRHADGEHRASALEGEPLVVRQVQDALEGFEVLDAVPDLPAPVVPLAVARLREERAPEQPHARARVRTAARTRTMAGETRGLNSFLGKTLSVE